MSLPHFARPNTRPSAADGPRKRGPEPLGSTAVAPALRAHHHVCRQLQPWLTALRPATLRTASTDRGLSLHLAQLVEPVMTTCMFLESRGGRAACQMFCLVTFTTLKSVPETGVVPSPFT